MVGPSVTAERDDDLLDQTSKHDVPRKVRWRRALQLAVTLGAFAYLYSIVDRHALLQAFGLVSPAAWAMAVLLTCASLSCGAFRWWLLFRAFGALRPPSLSRLGRQYLIGQFYNTYLPGGVTGDIVRGHAAQDAWPAGSAGGFASVLIERVLGLSALLGLTTLAIWLHPLPGSATLVVPAVVAFAALLLGAWVLASFGRLSRFAPSAWLRRLLARVPVPSAWLPLMAALVVSFGCQLAPALCGHLLLRSIYPRVALLDSLAIVPLASASAFLPISVSGIGVRETVFVELYSRVGVPAQAALAASLAMWLAQAAVAAVGGIYVLLRRDA
jgi:glycosyltransferase 2 family protein